MNNDDMSGDFLLAHEAYLERLMLARTSPGDLFTDQYIAAYFVKVNNEDVK